MPADQLHIDLGERVPVRVAGADQAVVHHGDDAGHDRDNQDEADEADHELHGISSPLRRGPTAYGPTLKIGSNLSRGLASPATCRR